LALNTVIIFLGKQHNSEFSRLIAQVRGRMESKRTQIKQEEGKSKEETDSKGPISVSSFFSDCV